MTSNERYLFPFGLPVKACAPSADSQRKLFVLGAYPSALHVRWTPPKGTPGGKINAMPVDNEPEPFWNGSDAEERVAQWKREVRFTDAWGAVDAPPGLNGPSGAWVDANVLQRCGVTRADAWITDCLNTYHVSNSGQAAIGERFAPFAGGAGLAIPHIAGHPTEAQIVARALELARAARLRAELRTAAADTIVTLGNAALRVMRKLVDQIDGANPGTRLRVDGYGKVCNVIVNGRAVAWYPLCHPAAPEAYQEAHKHWTCTR